MFNALAKSSQKKYKENIADRELLHDIALAKLELEIANQNFSYATDALLVDVYAYQIKAAQAKYSYLLQKARRKELKQYDYLKKTFENKAQ